MLCKRQYLRPHVDPARDLAFGGEAPEENTQLLRAEVQRLSPRKLERRHWLVVDRWQLRGKLNTTGGPIARRDQRRLLLLGRS